MLYSDSPSNLLFAVAKRRMKSDSDSNSNYFLVVQGGKIVSEVTDPQAALVEQYLSSGLVAGATLYAFYEPSTDVLDQAWAAGIKRAYTCLSARDARNLGLLAAGIRVPRTHPLKPRKVQWVREEVLRHLCGEDKSVEWLLMAAKHAIEFHSNYFLVIRGEEIVAKGINLQAALTDVNGGILYAFCEPTPTELGLVKAAGIERVYCGISKHDGQKLGVYPEGPEGPEPIRIRRAREIILKELSKW